MVVLVCADASLALKLISHDELTPQVEGIWRYWRRIGAEVVTPPLFFAEVTSVIRASVYFKRILPEFGEQALSAFLKLGIREENPPDLQSVAWQLAKKYNRPRTYDAQYLAVASILGCELWTADHRLVNAISAPWVRWVGEYKANDV